MIPRPLAAAVLLAPVLALAEPATIRVFEAKAHASADAASPVVHTFPEGATVSVSETAEHGWRRIRLPDGATGWVLESDLALAGAASPAAAPPPPPATAAARPPAADLRPTIYVKDLDHFTQLVKEDPAVSVDAEALNRRHVQARWVGGVGLAAGLALVLGGVWRMDADTNHDVFSPDFGKRTSNAGPTMVVVGAGTLTVAVIYALVREPRRAEWLDVLNAWNTRHPDRQFTIEHGVGAAR